MSDFNWCHGPECHTYVTTDRVRGSKGHKVLRTKKVTNRYGKSMYGNVMLSYGIVYIVYVKNMCI